VKSAPPAYIQGDHPGRARRSLILQIGKWVRGRVRIRLRPQPQSLRTFSDSLYAREAEWELGTLATDNIVRHSRRAEITTLHEVTPLGILSNIVPASDTKREHFGPFGSERLQSMVASPKMKPIIPFSQAPWKKPAMFGANVTGDALFVTVQPIGLRPLIGGERSNHPAGSE
jgi:hypothetical protein